MIRIKDIDYEGTPFYNKIQLFLQAVNDWDEDIESVEEFLFRISEYLGGSLAYEKDTMTKILIKKNIFEEAWKVESLSTLLNLLEAEETLEEALNKLFLIH
jgi:hypothetical protein